MFCFCFNAVFPASLKTAHALFLGNRKPRCASLVLNALFSAEGAVQTTAAEVAAAERRIKAALTEKAAKAFPKGTKVTWTSAHSVFPDGIVGTVRGPKDGKPGNLRVEFPKGTWHFAAANLRRPGRAGP